MPKTVFFATLLLLTTHLSLAQRPDFSPEVRSFIRVDAPVVARTNVTVIDGMGTPSRAGQTIVIEGDRIAAVGPVGEVGIPAEAEVLDLSEHTVLPGIIGLHNHTYYTAQFDESSPRLYLASGVTTIRTTGSWDPFKDINLKYAIAEGKAPGPTLFVTGPYLSGSGGMGNMKQLAGGVMKMCLCGPFQLILFLFRIPTQALHYCPASAPLPLPAMTPLPKK